MKAEDQGADEKLIKQPRISSSQGVLAHKVHHLGSSRPRSGQPILGDAQPSHDIQDEMEKAEMLIAA